MRGSRDHYHKTSVVLGFLVPQLVRENAIEVSQQLAEKYSTSYVLDRKEPVPHVPLVHGEVLKRNETTLFRLPRAVFLRSMIFEVGELCRVGQSVGLSIVPPGRFGKFMQFFSPSLLRLLLPRGRRVFEAPLFFPLTHFHQEVDAQVAMAEINWPIPTFEVVTFMVGKRGELDTCKKVLGENTVFPTIAPV